ncbi:MAG TPA: SUMF1/EgtB/PvdO family nonheme iron enzyme [Caulobacteraceae bacterium]|nr:SUMF1/EgtB/PvdO family nonheme iron enzyme [Caulobacteraceae bacterium]
MRLEIMAAAIVATAAFAGPASADARADWLAARQAEVASWRAAHPDVEARTADIRARTGSLVDAWRAARSGQSGAADADLDLAPVILKASDGPAELWDGPEAPRMVVIPAGVFTMGSPGSESDRQSNEGPRRRVTIGYALAVSMFPITRDEYADFVADTDRGEGSSCTTLRGDQFVDTDGRGWRNPGEEQTGREPAVCISFADATAYVQWLSRKTGQTYRLLSEAEYEFAERGGTTSAYFWGDDPALACANANGADQDAKTRIPGIWRPNTCHDRYPFASPVGSFAANPFGLFDVSGNVWSWTQDCYADSYKDAPIDGSAREGGACGRRTLRGGSWWNDPGRLRSAVRYRADPGCMISLNGFRVARVL